MIVVIPTYNERDNLATIVDQVLAVPDTRILVVDDASPDGTGAIADQLAVRHAPRVSVVHRTGIRGLGPAFLDGFRAALAAGTDAVCQMDADGSHDARDLPSLVAALRDADLVIGSRYIPGAHVYDWPLSRRLLSATANAYIRAVLGLRIHDVTGGFRLWRASALQKLNLDRVRSRGHGFQVEMTYTAARADLRIVESPIRFRDRTRGESKVSGRIIFESLTAPWRLRMDARRASGATTAATR